MPRRMTPSLLAAALLIASAAQAHPKLLKSTPVADGRVAAPAAITLVFSEKLVPQFTGVELIVAAMPGMAEMKIDGLTTKVAADGKTLKVTPKTRLARGGYRVDWHAVAADTHRIKGSFAFTVR